MKHLRLTAIAVVTLFSASAHAFICDAGVEHCWKKYGGGGGGSTASAAYPSSGSRFSINPSAVPVQKQIGVESIEYNNQWDLAFVSGTGRVGAAVSPSNGEETFFGPPGFELDNEYLERKMGRQKYESQKVALATAMSLFENKQKGLKHFELNLGLIAKYNKLSQATSPGAGLSGVIGPLTFSYSRASDEHVFDYAPYGLDQRHQFKYGMESYSLGMYLTSVAVDYSILQITSDELARPMRVTLLTGSLMLSRFILTASSRTEDSDRPAFDEKQNILVAKPLKSELFLGAQAYALNQLLLGIFYNYYNLHEISLGATLFF